MTSVVASDGTSEGAWAWGSTGETRGETEIETMCETEGVTKGGTEGETISWASKGGTTKKEVGS